MGDLLGLQEADVGTVPVCGACGSERVLRMAQVCWNRSDGVWEIETLKDQMRCQACDDETSILWKPVDGAKPVDRIQELNDRFRMSGEGKGTVLVTSGIQALGAEALLEIVAKVRSFSDFSAENDPWGEHDFGAVDHDGEKVFWRIDYYDLDQSAGSPNPANPAVTHRVLTIMLASEY